MHEFVQRSVFSPTTARFVIFALGAPLFSDFQQSTRFCAKQCFSPDINTFCHFRTGRTTFKQFSAKCTSLFKTEVLSAECTTFKPIQPKCTSLYKTAFSARLQHVLSFWHWPHHCFAIFSKVQEFVQNRLFSPRLAGFVIFALGAPLFSDFQQSARVSTRQLFHPEISVFCHV